MALQREQTDPLAVLSMHQPWASLLVYGIKRIEGRTWPTEHRGRLWIHATSTAPNLEEVQELEAFYTALHEAEGNRPSFPASYPQSALLGTVQIVGCLQKEEMTQWEELPETLQQEAMSPQCWLCESPKRLVLPQKMPGHPKVWRLPTRKMANDLERALKDPPALIPFAWPRPIGGAAAERQTAQATIAGTAVRERIHGAQPKARR